MFFMEGRSEDNVRRKIWSIISYAVDWRWRTRGQELMVCTYETQGMQKVKVI